MILFAEDLVDWMRRYMGIKDGFNEWSDSVNPAT
jgi:hypothetical protein